MRLIILLNLLVVERDIPHRRVQLSMPHQFLKTDDRHLSGANQPPGIGVAQSMRCNMTQLCAGSENTQPARHMEFLQGLAVIDQ